MAKSKKQKKLDAIFEKYSEEKGFEYKLMNYKTKEVLNYCKGPRILDIGCGVGILTKVLAEKFDEVVGIDGSTKKIEIARNYNQQPNIEYIHTLFEDYNVKDKFNTIVMTNVLEHIENPISFLKKIRSWLVKRGILVVTVPNAKALHKQLGKEMGLTQDYYELTKADKEKGHFKNYDKNLLEEDFKKAGFSIQKVQGFFLKPFSSKQMEAFDDKVLDGLYKLGKKYPNLCSSLIGVGVKE